MKTHITGPSKTAIRNELRKLFKAGRLEYRQTYYDYYDSCHAPDETPDAQWSTPCEHLYRDLYAGGPSLYLIGPGHYELSTGYKTYELRLKTGGLK